MKGTAKMLLITLAVILLIAVLMKANESKWDSFDHGAVVDTELHDLDGTR